MEKVCSSCKINKSFDSFNKSKNSPFGLHRQCKSCRKIERDTNKERTRKKNQEYYKKNKESLLKKNKIYRKNNKDKINIQRKEYRNRPEIVKHVKMKNKEYLPKRKIKIKERRKNDLNFQLSEILRAGFNRFIKGSSDSYRKCIKCDYTFLMKWLEFQFNDKMNWNNLGSYWHIDHILPVSLFNFEKEKEKFICYNWTNLQPLEKKENISKSNKIELFYFMNSIVNVHRFIQHNQSNFNGYQALNESLKWLREKLRYGKNPSRYMGNPQPSS